MAFNLINNSPIQGKIQIQINIVQVRLSQLSHDKHAFCFGLADDDFINFRSFYNVIQIFIDILFLKRYVSIPP